MNRILNLKSAKSDHESNLEFKNQPNRVTTRISSINISRVESRIKPYFWEMTESNHGPNLTFDDICESKIRWPNLTICRTLISIINQHKLLSMSHPNFAVDVTSQKLLLFKLKHLRYVFLAGVKVLLLNTKFLINCILKIELF